MPSILLLLVLTIREIQIDIHFSTINRSIGIQSKANIQRFCMQNSVNILISGIYFWFFGFVITWNILAINFAWLCEYRHCHLVFAHLISMNGRKRRKSEPIGNLNRVCVTNICPFAFIRKICNHNSWIVNTLAVIVNFPIIYYTLHQWDALQIVTRQNIEKAMQPFQFSSIRRSTSLSLPSFIRLYCYVVMSRIVTFYLIYFFLLYFFLLHSLIVVFILSMIHPIS